jgi:hypothetical protein
MRPGLQAAGNRQLQAGRTAAATAAEKQLLLLLLLLLPLPLPLPLQLPCARSQRSLQARTLQPAAPPLARQLTLTLLGRPRPRGAPRRSSGLTTPRASTPSTRCRPRAWACSPCWTASASSPRCVPHPGRGALCILRAPRLGWPTGVHTSMTAEAGRTCTDAACCAVQVALGGRRPLAGLEACWGVVWQQQPPATRP